MVCLMMVTGWVIIMLVVGCVRSCCLTVEIIVELVIAAAAAFKSDLFEELKVCEGGWHSVCFRRRQFKEMKSMVGVSAWMLTICVPGRGNRCKRSLFDEIKKK